MKIFKFEIGEVVDETITGLCGIVMARTQYFTGCNHYGIQVRSLDKDGKIRDYEWIDEQRLSTTGEHVSLPSPYDFNAMITTETKAINVKKTSGPMQNPPSY